MGCDVKLTECISPAFYKLHWSVLRGEYTYYDLIGGRGSTKSSFISIEIVLGIMQDENANAIVYRKVGDTIRESVYEQIVWAIEKLGVNNKWKCTVSPFCCTYLPTGQKIIFKGLDKASKSKSVKVARGYFKFLWFEEWDEYAGAEEIRSVQQSVMRGGPQFVVFRSMNPPRSKNSWANKEVELDKLKKDCIVLHTTYLDTPVIWLGEQFVKDAEFLKKVNRKAYDHEYMGIPVGLGNEVFDNVVSLEINAALISSFNTTYQGIDWGWQDPFHWSKCSYNKNRRDLYIYDEYRTNKTSNLATWEYLHTKKHVRGNDLITADSAEPKSIGDYRAYGSNCRGAEKGADSVKYSIKWLQSLCHIYIDPIICPHTYREFRDCEYELTPEGEPTGVIPDINNHAIDSVRYATNPIWRRRGA